MYHDRYPRGRSPRKTCKTRGTGLSTEGWCDGDPQAFDPQRANPIRRRADGLQPHVDPVHLLQQGMCFRRGDHAQSDAFEQAHLSFPLQQRHGAAHVRLRRVQLLGGKRHRARVHHRSEALDLAEIHIDNASRVSGRHYCRMVRRAQHYESIRLSEAVRRRCGWSECRPAKHSRGRRGRGAGEDGPATPPRASYGVRWGSALQGSEPRATVPGPNVSFTPGRRRANCLAGERWHGRAGHLRLHDAADAGRLGRLRGRVEARVQSRHALSVKRVVGHSEHARRPWWRDSARP